MFGPIPLLKPYRGEKRPFLMPSALKGKKIGLRKEGYHREKHCEGMGTLKLGG